MSRFKRGGWPYGHPPNTQFELNTLSPQARGLVAWWTAHRWAAHRESARGRRATVVGMNWQAYSRGPAYYQDTDGQEITMSPTIDIAAGSDCSFLWYGQIDAWSSIGNPGLWRDGEGERVGNTLINFQTTTGRPRVRWSNANILEPAAGHGVPLGVPVTLLYVIKSSSYVEFYQDGVLRHSNAHATATPAFSVFELGWQWERVERITGSWQEFRFYNRVITPSEAWAIHDPVTRWELYHPTVRFWGIPPIFRPSVSADDNIAISEDIDVGTSEPLVMLHPDRVMVRGVRIYE